MKNAWTENNTSSNIVKAGFDDIQASSRHIYDASYFRVKSLSVNYDIPLKKKVRKHITGISVGVSADNLFLAKNYPGFCVNGVESVKKNSVDAEIIVE